MRLTRTKAFAHLMKSKQAKLIEPRGMNCMERRGDLEERDVLMLAKS